MEDMYGSIIPGVVFIILGLWWLIAPLHKYFNSRQKHPNHKPNEDYFSSSSYNCSCYPKIPFEGLLKICGAVACIAATIAQRNNHDRPSHGTLYIGYVISGVVDVIKTNTKLLPKGSGYVSLIMAHILEVLLLHIQQSSEVKVKIGELPYVGNDTHLVGDLTHVEMNTKFQYYIGQSTIENYTEFLMSLTILGVCILLIAEMKFRRVLGLAVVRAIFCLLHGSWLCQIGLLTRDIDRYDPVASYSSLVNLMYGAHVGGAVVVAGIAILTFYLVYFKNLRLYSAFRSVPTDFHI